MDQSLPNSTKTIFILADHGLAIIYFMQSDLVKTLLANGLRVVLLTDEKLVEQIRQRFDQPGLIVEGLRYDRCADYAETVRPGLQYWLNFLRRVGASRKINTEAMDGHINQVETEMRGKQRLILPITRLAIWILRHSRTARGWLIRWQTRFTADIYNDLFTEYDPCLVVSSTYGWRFDRYLLREAVRHGVKAGAVIIGWDNPSSYGIPAAPLDFVTCWSEIQKQELILGSDWKPEQVSIGGIPSYDGYFRKEWLIPKEEYYALHNLDPKRKLICYASSFITFSPNLRNVETLAKMVANDELDEPCQLLIRLHPNHFMDEQLYIGERENIRQLARQLPHVHVVEPVALGGDFGYYSGEDMPEKTSMMAYADVFTTVYSTMCVETAIQDKPIVSICLDIPGGWNRDGKFSLALKQIGNWPTHQRFREAGAGKVALDEATLKEHLNAYLKDANLDSAARRKFVLDEVTYTDGSAGRRTGKWLANLAKGTNN